jgi:hypothetical protein
MHTYVDSIFKDTLKKLSLKDDDISATRGGRGKHEGNRITHDISASEEYA